MARYYYDNYDEYTPPSNRQITGFMLLMYSNAFELRSNKKSSAAVAVLLSGAEGH